MSYDIDADKMTDVLRVGKEKISDKGIASAKKRVDPLKRQAGIPRTEIIETMVSTFAARYGAIRTQIGEATLERADRLADEKFRTDEWLNRVP